MAGRWGNNTTIKLLSSGGAQLSEFEEDRLTPTPVSTSSRSSSHRDDGFRETQFGITATTG